MNKSIVRTAGMLTYAGILPFLLMSFAVIVKARGYDFNPALRAYGAVIISFLCGIHWGIYILCSGKCPRNLLLYSNLIAMIAFGSILFELHGINLIIQSACLVSLLKLDHELFQKDIIPLWYFRLRRNATFAVVVLLMTAGCF